MATLVRHRYHLRNDARGRRADLSFTDLTGLTLKDQELNGIIFKGACLHKVDFSHCDLTGADFFGADLESANLTGANLTGVDFRGANLHRAVLSNCNLSSADFRAGTNQDNRACLTEAKLDHSFLQQANLTGCDMSGADLVDADLSGADLSQTVLLGADLSGASLKAVKLADTVLSISCLSPAQLGDLGSTEGLVEPSYLKLADDVVTSKLEEHGKWIVTGGAKGARLNLEGIDLRNYIFSVRSLAGGRLRRCNLSETDLREIVLDMVDFSYSNLREANLDKASMRGVNLRSADLSGAKLTAAMLEAMPLEPGRTWPANLDQARLCNADLTGACFDNAVMTNTDLVNCIISETRFRNVDLSKVKRSGNGTERRRVTRFSEPTLYVKTPLGVFTTINWSFGGVCLSFDETERFPVDTEIKAAIVAKKFPPPRPVSLTVVKDTPDSGKVLMRFTAVDNDLQKYLAQISGEPA
ncbi:MAG: pentapeptide repeat-containing protein [Rhodospirillaceae bacterium]